MTESSSHNFWILLEVLAKRRGFIFAFVALVTVTAIVISLILPQWYEADVLLLPPKEMATVPDQMMQLAEVASLTGGLNLPVMVTPSDVYARVLQSRAVTDRIIDRFHLTERYHASNLTETYLALKQHARTRVTQEGLLTVTVEDRDPKTAADVANAFVDVMNELAQQIITERTQRTRMFIEDRLVHVEAELDSARHALEQFQLDYKAVDLDEQTKLAIDQAVQLKIALAEAELDLKVQEQSLGPANPQLDDLRKRRETISAQLQQIERGGGADSYLSLPLASIPSLKGQYAFLDSKVKVSETLYRELLLKLEQARIAERETAPTISVLDRARVPDVRSRPQRTFIVGASFGLSVFLAVLLAALLEYLKRLQNARPEDYRRALFALDAFVGWIPGMRVKRDKSTP